jgi:nucleoside-diphosphate-sugar epimerase
VKILVTGGAGYTGIPLCQALLDEGHQVTIVDSFMFGFSPILHLASHPNLSVVKRDIRNDDSDYLQGQDAVYHLAGISGYPACEANPNAARLINIDATRRLVSALSPDQLLIYASTTSFYGQSRTECRETDRIVPVNLYGESKKEGEDIVMQRANSISLRWATVFGSSSRMRNDLMVNDFVDKALRERTIVLYDPDSTRTFMHLSDLVNGYVFALKNKASMAGNIFNMGSTRLNYTKRQIAQNIQTQVPCEIIIAKSGDKDVRDFLVNFDKAKALGYDCKVSLQDGISELVKLYRFYTPNLYSAV